MTQSIVRVVTVSVLMFGAASPWAQGYPERPVRLVVGFPPGGSSDIVARVVAQPLTPLLGQPVVVENRPGAGGVIASDLVAKAPPDGYMLLLATAGHSVAAATLKKLPFDPVRDFAWISTITTYPFAVVTSTQSPLKSLGDLVARARAEPGKLTFASNGVGSSQHLLGEWFSSEAGVEMLHVPFKGGTAPLSEVMVRRVDIMFETMTAALPHIKSGKLRGLAVTSSQPTSFLADVPAAEQTLRGFVFQSWLGIAAPAGTPPAVVERLHRDLLRVLETTEVRKRLSELGGAAAPITPDAMRAQVESEVRRWQQLVDTRKIERQ